MDDELSPVIILPTTIIDRQARIVIERDPEVDGRLKVFVAGCPERVYDGDEARELWNFYDRDRGYRFKDDI